MKNMYDSTKITFQKQTDSKESVCFSYKPYSRIILQIRYTYLRSFGNPVPPDLLYHPK